MFTMPPALFSWAPDPTRFYGRITYTRSLEPVGIRATPFDWRPTLFRRNGSSTLSLDGPNIHATLTVRPTILFRNEEVVLSSNSPGLSPDPGVGQPTGTLVHHMNFNTSSTNWSGSGVVNVTGTPSYPNSTDSRAVSLAWAGRGMPWRFTIVDSALSSYNTSYMWGFEMIVEEKPPTGSVFYVVGNYQDGEGGWLLCVNVNGLFELVLDGNTYTSTAGIMQPPITTAWWDKYYVVVTPSFTRVYANAGKTLIIDAPALVNQPTDGGTTFTFAGNPDLAVTSGWRQLQGRFDNIQYFANPVIS